MQRNKLLSAHGAVRLRHRREEAEKLNVWVAWLNLESLHGAPSPDEAVMALFQRALQHCDQKKLYAALLAILQRTGKVRTEGLASLAVSLLLMCARSNASHWWCAPVTCVGSLLYCTSAHGAGKFGQDMLATEHALMNPDRAWWHLLPPFWWTALIEGAALLRPGRLL